MLRDRIRHSAHLVEPTDGSTRLLPNPARSHTPLQQVATSRLVNRETTRQEIARGSCSSAGPGVVAC
jgi:hypothetical protein